MHIERIGVHTVRASRIADDNVDQVAIVVVDLDDGSRGYGEANAHPGAVAAILTQDWGLGGWDSSIGKLLIGRPFASWPGLWAELVRATVWSCRSGVGHVARAALDTAVWDAVGRAQCVPTSTLISSTARSGVDAYATLYHGLLPFEETRARLLDDLDTAIAEGFTAVKVEALEGGTDAGGQVVELVAAARERAGPDVRIMLDVGYRWREAAQVRPLVAALDDLRLEFLEAAFPPEQLDDYRELGQMMTTPLASGDVLSAATDYEGLLATPEIAVIQAGAARTGISDMMSLAEAAQRRNKQFVPWGWTASAVGAAANLAHALAFDNVPFVEVIPMGMQRSMPLRRSLFKCEPEVTNGRYAAPSAFGLGVELDLAAVSDVAEVVSW